MTRKLLALALLLPAVPALHGCGGPLATAEVRDARITSTNVSFTSTGVAGPIGDVTADLGPLGKSPGSGFVTTLTLQRFEMAWNDPNPLAHDFSNVTSATLTVIPDPASGLQPKVIANYTQDPANKNPASLVIVGDPNLNFFDYLAGGVLTLRVDAQGTPPNFTALATAIADLGFKIEYSLK